MASCGFESLPEQIARRRTIRGLAFNVLVVGQTGIGKTTLINSLFDLDFGDSPDHDGELRLRAREFRPINNMKLTIIETKGFGSQLDNSRSYRPILDYIEAKYADYLRDEPEDINDPRVHCCIYMVPPTGLRTLDLATMRRLFQRVCLIPVIAKSDILTREERAALKEKIRHRLLSSGVSINHTIGQLPLAVAASNEIHDRRRVRSYPWGRMDIEAHSEFSQLKDLVLRANMLTFIELTNSDHYERYREDATSSDFQQLKRDYELERAAILKQIKSLQ